MHTPIIRTILTDDDIRVSDYLESLLLERYEDISVLAKTYSVQTTLDSIRTYKPNLLCLDVDLKGESCFDIIEQLDNSQPLPLIILITAHESYALKALKSKVLDYIVKPIEHEQLYGAIDKARNEIYKYYHYQHLKLHQENTPSLDSHLQVHLSEGIEFIRLQDITLLKADRNYTEIRLENNKKITSSRTLGHYEDILPKSLFYRSHRSFIVNLKKIESFRHTDGGYLILTNKTQAKISKPKRDELLNRINNHYLSMK